MASDRIQVKIEVKGPRASGKTSVLVMLKSELMKMGFGNFRQEAHQTIERISASKAVNHGA